MQNFTNVKFTVYFSFKSPGEFKIVLNFAAQFIMFPIYNTYYGILVELFSSIVIYH